MTDNERARAIEIAVKAYEIATKYFHHGRPLYSQDDIEQAIAAALEEVRAPLIEALKQAEKELLWAHDQIGEAGLLLAAQTARAAIRASNEPETDNG